ncbi:MAG TPA: L-threonylcarbamoyladenylate synthase [Oligoflexia bacterium]|nr:L-threonylcarbamoyladenylate synthase [Oligoflexia bacterium]HMP47590.1 L-threonylcarbamoyladenylate synthase [Oligoflexia bacterium]
MKIETQDLLHASKLLTDGHPIAIPTETVYGLAAPINNPEAIKKIFSLKERPFFDPLIVHISDISDLWPLIKAPTPIMRIVISSLSDTFWPGPLTMVLPKSDKINPMITSGLETVGVRCPNHPLTQSLLQMIKVPLAAPSANKFGKTSPTSKEHVQNTWTSNEVHVLDGGPCKIGIESTVIGFEQDPVSKMLRVEIMRKGTITQPEIRQVLEKSVTGHKILINEVESSSSPGHTKDHYMPEKPLIIVPSSFSHFSEKSLSELAANVPALYSDILSGAFTFIELKLDQSPEISSRILYSELRNLSAIESSSIIVKRMNATAYLKGEERNSGDCIWDAIWDRLKRAASFELNETDF